MSNLKFSNGKPAKFGDVVVITSNKRHFEIMVTPDTVNQLIAMGIIVKINPKEMTESKKLGLDIQARMKSVPMDIAFYHAILVEKMCQSGGLNTTTAEKALKAIKTFNKVSYFSLLLKEIAIELDKAYENHISKSTKLFTISARDGKPYELQTGVLKNTNTVSLFRSKVDAIIACKIIASLKKEIFSVRGK